MQTKERPIASDSKNDGLFHRILAPKFQKIEQSKLFILLPRFYLS